MSVDDGGEGMRCLSMLLRGWIGGFISDEWIGWMDVRMGERASERAWKKGLLCMGGTDDLLFSSTLFLVAASKGLTYLPRAIPYALIAVA